MTLSCTTTVGQFVHVHTCHVYIEEGMDSLPEITDKEEDFIDRAINPSINSRLACQCKISSDLTVTIPDQEQFNGH